MATFPKEEGKIFTFGQKMSSGLKANSDIFPAPPVNPLDLDNALNTYVAKRDAADAAQAIVEKQTALQALADKIKSNTRYAEQAVNYDDTKLKTIGWGGRKEPTPLAKPGQAFRLVATEQGADWIELRWEKPIDGGKPGAYKILARERGASEWRNEDTAMGTEIRLTGQPRGKELEYCVKAINKAGEGPESNAVIAVL
uniref:Fibronectin type III domain-containing protein n=1 Tax=Candidatus Kentrum sp. LPFa TaxID=2126335 RepID=A0A450XSH4_9GAMM|nr:MAG: Fibronectin type III domain-containing protein [Candidatus Kentron sp. LPFa]VFK32244.1 MAG: Fibronectin type III domain-containing protein [Candidatus Kentron sp. LPFa]